jgi:hypothetical protein
MTEDEDEDMSDEEEGEDDVSVITEDDKNTKLLGKR